MVLAQFRSTVLLLLAVLAQSTAASAQTSDNLCRRIPQAAAERMLGVKLGGADTLDDRIGPYRRVFCRWHAENGDVLEVVEWTRRDGQPVGAAPSRAEQCDATCIQAGREPNLYSYVQKAFGRVVCVVRQPRRDRDVNTGPLTGCYAGAVKRHVVLVQRAIGAAPATMETVQQILDLVASR
jgi:hypothetical protein